MWIFDVLIYLPYRDIISMLMVSRLFYRTVATILNDIRFWRALPCVRYESRPTWKTAFSDPADYELIHAIISVHRDEGAEIDCHYGRSAYGLDRERRARVKAFMRYIDDDKSIVQSALANGASLEAIIDSYDGVTKKIPLSNELEKKVAATGDIALITKYFSTFQYSYNLSTEEVNSLLPPILARSPSINAISSLLRKTDQPTTFTPDVVRSINAEVSNIEEREELIEKTIRHSILQSLPSIVKLIDQLEITTDPSALFLVVSALIDTYYVNERNTHYVNESNAVVPGEPALSTIAKYLRIIIKLKKAGKVISRDVLADNPFFGYSGVQLLAKRVGQAKTLAHRQLTPAELKIVSTTHKLLTTI